MQSTVAWSLNLDITKALGFGPTPNFQKIHLHLKWRISVRVHPCPSTAYQGAKTLSIYIMWMWYTVYGGLEPQP